MMKKTIDYYMKLPYTVELVPEADGGWFVSIRELPGCISVGDTPEEAVEMIRDAMEGWIEIALEDGDPVPEPRDMDDYSGKFVVRVPRSLHRDLVEEAKLEGVSLNQYLNVALGRTVGQRVPRDSEAEAQWPGLKAGVRDALVRAGHAADAQELDETLFSRWAEGCLMQAESALQGGLRYSGQAMDYLQALAQGLAAGERKSPVLAVFRRAVELMYQQVDVGSRFQQTVVDQVAMQNKISSAARHMNERFVMREEREAYSAQSTGRVESYER